MGRRYVCNDCGCIAFSAFKASCISCGSDSTAEVRAPASARCKLCKKEFKPHNSRQVACHICVARNRALSQAELARKRYARGTGGRRKGKYTGPKEPMPYAWLAGCLDERGRMSSKRLILTTLADQSAAGSFPWPDPLQPRECVIDSMPF